MLQNQIHTSPLPTWQKTVNRLVNRVTSRRAVHLFLLASPLSGSTMMMRLLDTSRSVAAFKVEGQRLPELIPVLNDDDRWDPHKSIDWQQVRSVFESYWSPWKPVRFDKSPPLIVRAAELETHFPNSHFMVLMRNPYAQIEGVVSRGWKPDPVAAACSWVRHTQLQVQNLDRLRNVKLIHYEDLTSDPHRVIVEMQEFVPQIGQVDLQAEILAHNVTGKVIKGVRNLNDVKIDRLTAKQIRQINIILERHPELMQRFGYEYLSANDHVARQRNEKRLLALEQREQKKAESERDRQQSLAKRAELKAERERKAAATRLRLEADREKRRQLIEQREQAKQGFAEAAQLRASKRQAAIDRRQEIIERRETIKQRRLETQNRRWQKRQEIIARREAFITNRERQRAERLQFLAERKAAAIARRGKRT